MNWKDARQRRDEVKAAFVEGLLIGVHELSPGEPVTEADAWRRSEAGIEAAWRRSRARARLGEPLEPVRFDPARTVARAELHGPEISIGEAVQRTLAPDE